MIKVTRHEEFEVAHVLPGYDGGCGNLHGHTYKIEVTVEGPQQGPYDMVIDFSDLKKAIKEIVPDHRFVCSDSVDPENDSLEMDIIDILEKYGIKYVIYPFVTTAENMVKHFAEAIDNYIKHEIGYKLVDVVEVKLWETTNSYAIWRKE